MYPIAVQLGMSKQEFIHSTPADILLRTKILNEQRNEEAKEMEYNAWISGLYVRAAIVSALSDKKRSVKYPPNPLLSEKNTMENAVKQSGKSEEELKQELAYYSLRVKQANANIAQAREGRKLLEQGG